MTVPNPQFDQSLIPERRSERWSGLRRVWRLLRVCFGIPSITSATKLLGNRGEQEARSYLRSIGYRVPYSNVYVPHGEADLVGQTADGAWAIVEVKTRVVDPTDAEAIAPEANITHAKRLKLRRIARHLARANQWPLQRVQIDVVAVECDPATHEPTRLRHWPAVVAVV